MSTSPVPPTTPPNPPGTSMVQPAGSGRPQRPSIAEREFREASKYFKWLAKITLSGLTIIVVATSIAAGILFDRSLKSAEKAASDKVKETVEHEFQQPKIQTTVQAAAGEAVGKITNEMVQNQVKTQIQNVANEFSLFGNVFESEVRMTMGVKAGYTELTNFATNSQNPDVRLIAKRSLERVTKGFDERVSHDQRKYADSPGNLLRTCINTELPIYLPAVMNVIQNSDDLYCVAVAFHGAAHAQGGPQLETFDFTGAANWCKQNANACQRP